MKKFWTSFGTKTKNNKTFFLTAMKQARSIPFKNKTKYVVERKVDGEKTFFWKEGGEGIFEPENSVDTRVASVICDEDFVLEGYTCDDVFYASDIIYFDGEDLRDESWPDRYRVLKNEFRWNSAVKINRPLVVTDKQEMMEAVKIFELLGDCEGLVIRDYHSSYKDDNIFVPREVFD